MNYFEFRLMVSGQDIDELNHAGNYHYIKWMQQAAIAHSTALGWSPQKYIELGAGWVVRSHKIVYLKPAFEGDSVMIKTWVSNMKAVTSLRRYEFYNDKGEMLAESETDWAFINYEKQKPVRIPAVIADNFELS